MYDDVILTFENAFELNALTCGRFRQKKECLPAPGEAKDTPPPRAREMAAETATLTKFPALL